MARARYKTYHVVSNLQGDHKWRVEGEDSRRASSWHDRKDDAVARGRALAQARKGQLKIHKMDGTIETEYTYGHDPADKPS